MGGKLVDFMLKVAQDPGALAEFQRDPQGAVAGAGLSRADQSILRLGNPAKIRDAVVRDIGDRVSDSADTVIVITLTWVSSMEAGLNLDDRFNEAVARIR